MLVTGQVHGGVAQGIGQALYEGVAYSEEGQLLTASYQDYCVPRADDIPPIAVTLDDSAPCRTNPLGAKGCGESGAIGGPPCITNGVMDALERTRHQAAQHAADAGQGLAGDPGCEGGGGITNDERETGAVARTLARIFSALVPLRVSLAKPSEYAGTRAYDKFAIKPNVESAAKLIRFRGALLCGEGKAMMSACKLWSAREADLESTDRYAFRLALLVGPGRRNDRPRYEVKEAVDPSDREPAS